MIHYSVTPQDLHGHLFSVELTIEQPAALQVFRLPAWMSDYMVRDFAKI